MSEDRVTTAAPDVRSPARRFYDRQIALLEAGDVDGVVTEQYHPDAVLVGFDFVVAGEAALRTHFRNYLARLGRIKLVSTDHFAETEDSLFFEATVEVSGGTARVYDVFVLRGDKAARHFTGLLSFTPA